jgi:hypothetical protein
MIRWWCVGASAYRVSTYFTPNCKLRGQWQGRVDMTWVDALLYRLTLEVCQAVGAWRTGEEIMLETLKREIIDNESSDRFFRSDLWRDSLVCLNDSIRETGQLGCCLGNARRFRLNVRSECVFYLGVVSLR